MIGLKENLQETIVITAKKDYNNAEQNYEVE